MLLLSAAGFGLHGAVGARPADPSKAQPEVWETLQSPPYPRKRDDIIFINSAIGYYGTGQGELYRTQDGGASWTLAWSSPGTFIRSVNFIDRDHGFLGNLGPGLAGTTDGVPLYRTIDGGQTWQATSLDGSLVSGVCAIDILRTTAILEGRLASRVIVTVAGRANGPAGFARSDDGGAHWRAFDLSRQAGMILDVKFLDSNIGLLFAGTDADPTVSRALILRTTDGGNHWSEVYRSDRIGEIIWKSSFPSPTVGYATVQNENPSRPQQFVLKSNDAGLSWQELPLVADAKATEFGIGFISARRGWVGTAAGGFATRDGGRSWRRTGLARLANKIRTVTVSGDRKVYAIGTEIQVLR